MLPMSRNSHQRENVPERTLRADRDGGDGTQGGDDGQDNDLMREEDEGAGIVDERPLLAHSDVKLARSHGVC